MKIQKITKSNAQFQIFESLKRSREKRNQYKSFIMEGVKPINTFIENNGEVKSLIYKEGSQLSNWAEEIISSSKDSDVYELSEDLYVQLSDRDDPSELLLVGGIKEQIIPKLSDNRSVFLVLDRPKNPGNLGSIIRSADAIGVNSILILGHATDLYDPQTIRASIGSCFATPVYNFESNNEFAEWLEEVKKKDGVKVLGTSANGEGSLIGYSFPKHTILMMGNETSGLSNFLKEVSDELLTIPMNGVASSLNLACATTLALYEINRGIN